MGSGGLKGVLASGSRARSQTHFRVGFTNIDQNDGTTYSNGKLSSRHALPPQQFFYARCLLTKIIFFSLLLLPKRCCWLPWYLAARLLLGSCVACLGCSPGLLSLVALLHCFAFEWLCWDALLLGGPPGLLYWVALLGCSPAWLFWVALLGRSPCCSLGWLSWIALPGLLSWVIAFLECSLRLLSRMVLLDDSSEKLSWIPLLVCSLARLS